MKPSPASLAVSKNLRRLAEALADALEDIAGRPMHFTLVVFGTEAGDACSYITTCDRESSIRELSTLLETLKAEVPDIPAHKLN